MRDVSCLPEVGVEVRHTARALLVKRMCRHDCLLPDEVTAGHQGSALLALRTAHFEWLKSGIRLSRMAGAVSAFTSFITAVSEADTSR